MSKCRDCFRVIDPTTGTCANDCARHRRPHKRANTEDRAHEAQLQRAARDHQHVSLGVDAGAIVASFDPQQARRREEAQRRALIGWGPGRRDRRTG